MVSTYQYACQKYLAKVFWALLAFNVLINLYGLKSTSTEPSTNVSQSQEICSSQLAWSQHSPEKEILGSLGTHISGPLPDQGVWTPSDSREQSLPLVARVRFVLADRNHNSYERGPHSPRAPPL